MGCGGGADRFRQKIHKQRVENGQQRVAARFVADDRLAVGQERITVEVGIQTASAMPEHGLHAVLGVLEIDTVVVEMAPDLCRAEIAIQEAKHREGIEELLFGLEDQVDAVGIEHHPVTLEHIHHLHQMLGMLGQQGLARQQTPLQFRSAGHAAGVGEQGGNDRHQPNPPGAASRDWS